MKELLFEHRGEMFPEFIRNGNACEHIATTALHFCKGRGVDIGAGKWPLPGAVPIELKDGGDAMQLGHRDLDFCFASHSLEHLIDPVGALLHWKDCLRPGGVLFLSLPHPSMKHWRPANCRRHLHLFWPTDVAETLRDLGFKNVIHSERDLYWSFQVLGFKPRDELDRWIAL